MVAEFESDLIPLRAREGMKVAKAKGRLRGKQPKLNREQEAHLVSLLHSGEFSTPARLGRPPTCRTATTAANQGATHAMDLLTGGHHRRDSGYQEDDGAHPQDNDCKDDHPPRRPPHHNADRLRQNLDRHPHYILAACMASEREPTCR
jgi:hypothetical protein